MNILNFSEKRIVKWKEMTLVWCSEVGKNMKNATCQSKNQMQLHADRGEIAGKLLKTPFQIEKIKASAELNTKVLDAVAEQIHAGMRYQKILTKSYMM